MNNKQGQSVLDTFPKIKNKQSRVDHVCEVIKDGIIQGYWKPGDRIDENLLAKQLEVSRLTVREALSKLGTIKIVEQKHWKGFQLREFSQDEIRNILEIRSYLEIFVFQRFINNFQIDQIKTLESCIEEAELFLKNNNIVNFRIADFKFHKEIQKVAGNTWASDFLEQLYFLIDIIRFHYCNLDYLEISNKSVKQHKEIINHMKAKQFKKAMEAVQKHHNDFEQYILQWMLKAHTV